MSLTLSIVECSAVTIATVAQFPSMKAQDLLAILVREPLGYRVLRQSGAHRHLVAEGRPRVLFSYHDGVTVPPGVVRKILVGTVGLEESDALRLLR
jgi:predicted RNA binding protein YcfA (HicA-like mRNA interferase family)